MRLGFQGKEQGSLTESSIKNSWKLIYNEQITKTIRFFWYVNNSEYHHREMGLQTGENKLVDHQRSGTRMHVWAENLRMEQKQLEQGLADQDDLTQQQPEHG